MGGVDPGQGAEQSQDSCPDRPAHAHQPTCPPSQQGYGQAPGQETEDYQRSIGVQAEAYQQLGGMYVKIGAGGLGLVHCDVVMKHP